jgi:PAS domain S-box-containing protein
MDGPRPLPDPRNLPSAEALAELSDLAYFEVDADRNVVAMSPAMERLTGFRTEDVLGRSCLTVNRCQECLKGCAVFRNGAVEGASISLFTADGEAVDVLKSGRVFRDEEGNITGALEVVVPVESLGMPPARSGPPPELDMLMRSLGRLFIVVDESFRITAHGRDLPAMTGRSSEALRGLPVSTVLGDELFGDDASFRAWVTEGHRREGWQASLRHADGTETPVSLTVGALDPEESCAGLRGRYVVMIRAEKARGSLPSFHGIVSRSPAMQRIFRVVELLGDNDSTVLVTGESGTGKELVARALHATSHRRDGPMVAVNCAAIPPELLESELFGHVRGAFTGAVKDRPGRFELADGGTLFLDEIGDLELSLQAKILRFLQERTFERVGDSRTRQVDVRVIAATHVNLVQAVSERRFREDLYYRLRVVPIHIPPLRERLDDLELLIRHLMGKIGKERGRSLRLAPLASRALLEYPWPGNVRELENALEYATTVCEGQTIHVADLPREIAMGLTADGGTPDNAPEPSTSNTAEGEVPAPPAPTPPTARPEPAESHEVRRIRAALEQAHYRKGAAADLLGISRTTLWRKMRELGL